jgi:hypothetical protein
VTQQIWAARFALDGIPPTAPGELRANGEDTSILLQWQTSSDESGLVGYEIYRSTTAEGLFKRVSTGLVTSTSYRDVGLTNQRYFYQVLAVDSTGNRGSFSNIANATAQVGADLPVHGLLTYEVGDTIRLRDFANLGAERTLTQGRLPHFANDGARLFYAVTGGILSQALQGEDLRVFYEDQRLSESYDLAADETHFGVTFQRQFARPGIPALCTVLEPHLGITGQLVNKNLFGLDSELAISPDGQWLAYRHTGYCTPAALVLSEPGDFCVAQRGREKHICLEHADFHDPDFAASGQWLVFAAPLTGQYEIWKAQLQTDGALRHFAQLTSGPTGQPARAPAWSSNGNWVVFQRDANASTGEDWRLWVVRADGAMLRPLNIAGEHPAWYGGAAAPPPVDLTEHLYLPLLLR